MNFNIILSVCTKLNVLSPHKDCSEFEERFGGYRHSNLLGLQQNATDLTAGKWQLRFKFF